MMIHDRTQLCTFYYDNDTNRILIPIHDFSFYRFDIVRNFYLSHKILRLRKSFFWRIIGFSDYDFFEKKEYRDRKNIK